MIITWMGVARCLRSRMSEEREVTTLRLLLRCTTAVHPNDIRHEKISLRSLSSTSVSELKHSIQETFDIPSCVQVVKWEGLELKGAHRLQDFRIRSEDEITVEYYSEGDCISVQESVQWMSTVIVSLLTRKNDYKVLIKEDLLDYVTCLPWHTSGSVQERAKELVTTFKQATDVNIQPPSLLNMTKATVAKLYCGLDNVLEHSVPELVWELLNSL